MRLPPTPAPFDPHPASRFTRCRWPPQAYVVYVRQRQQLQTAWKWGSAGLGKPLYEHACKDAHKDRFFRQPTIWSAFRKHADGGGSALTTRNVDTMAAGPTHATFFSASVRLEPSTRTQSIAGSGCEAAGPVTRSVGEQLAALAPQRVLDTAGEEPEGQEPAQPRGSRTPVGRQWLVVLRHGQRIDEARRAGRQGTALDLSTRP